MSPPVSRGLRTRATAPSPAAGRDLGATCCEVFSSPDASGHGISPDPLVRRGRRAASVTYWAVGLLLATTPLFWGWIGLSYATG